MTRRARLNSSVTATSDLASADVYEFRDDSEEEARPRLILTIKSPPDPAAAVAVPSAAAAAPASPPSQTAPASTSNLPQPVCRKSRRLQVSTKSVAYLSYLVRPYGNNLQVYFKTLIPLLFARFS